MHENVLVGMIIFAAIGIMTTMKNKVRSASILIPIVMLVLIVELVRA